MKRISLGFMALALTFSAMAQTNDKNNGDKQQLHQEQKANRREMFEKLNLSSDQKAQIKSINDNFRQQMQDLHKQENLTIDEQRQRREALVKEHKEKIDAVLTPDQRKQADASRAEFKAQRKEGRGANRLDELTKNLNLTPEQSSKISDLNATLKTNIKDIRQNASLSEDQKREQIKSLMKKHRSDVETLLTSDQKEQLKNNLKNRPNRTAVK
jgi:Spy/CpxP family protein refolding chaperone